MGLLFPTIDAGNTTSNSVINVTHTTYWYMVQVSTIHNISTITNTTSLNSTEANRIERHTANTDGPLGAPARPQIDPAGSPARRLQYIRKKTFTEAWR